LRRPFLAALALAAAAIFAPPGSAAASSCPTGSFLGFQHLVFRSEALPASSHLTAGSKLGSGLLDEPTSANGCDRKQGKVDVVGLAGVDPSVAVGVDGRPGIAFVLGARCSGYGRTGRWVCLRRPLRFRGENYAGVGYPTGAGRLPLAGPLGPALLERKPVRAVRLAGVDPAVAVSVAGRRGEVFLAPGACPYERFSARPTFDDLRRCLTGPVWLVFDPPGGRVATTIEARPDRALAPALAGATVTLDRLRIAADLVPRNPRARARIGALGRDGISFSAPDVPPGLYEAVVTCRRCAVRNGETRFPAGSVLISPKRGGSSGARAVVIGIGALILALGVAAAVVFGRNRRRRTTGSEPGAP
jgi:hypothetical protein